MSYGASFDITQPETFDRAQIFLRLLIAIILGALAGSVGWIFGAAYIVVPVIAAVLISQRGPARYLSEAEGTMVKGLGIYVGLRAYLFLLTDVLPGSGSDLPFRFSITTDASPTVGSTLMRIIFGIPHMLVVGLLSVVCLVLMVIAAVMILFREDYPAGIFGFNRGVLRWEVRLLGYMASLVDAYPPFEFDSGPTAEG